MKVRMLTLSAGPSGIVKPGTVIDVPESEAKQLIEGRYAEKLEAPTPTRPATLPPKPPAANGSGKPAANGAGGDKNGDQDKDKAQK